MSMIIKLIKKHKKKVIFTCVMFGGYYAVKFGFRKLTDSLLSHGASQLAGQHFLAMRKTEHYLTIKQTSDEAVKELLKSMNEQLNMSFPTEELFEELKTKPANKLEIWENLKILSVSKFMAEVYSIAFLTLFIKIELSIIGAHLFLNKPVDSLLDFNIDLNKSIKQQQDEEGNADDDEEVVMNPNVQKKYLENIENFIRNGLPKLINRIKTICNDVFKEINLKENLTVDTLADKFDLVRSRLETESSEPNGEDEEEDGFLYQATSKSKKKSAKSFNDVTIDLDKLDEIVVLKDDDDDQQDDDDNDAETFRFARDYLWTAASLSEKRETADYSTAAAEAEKEISIDLIQSINDNQSIADLKLRSRRKTDDQILHDINMETLDLIECSDCQLVLNSLVESVLSEHLNHLTSNMIQQILSNDIDHNEKITIGLPFAKLIPILTRLDLLKRPNTSDHLIQKLLENKYLNIFSANIYEAFSVSKNAAKQQQQQLANQSSILSLI